MALALRVLLSPHAALREEDPHMAPTPFNEALFSSTAPLRIGCFERNWVDNYPEAYTNLLQGSTGIRRRIPGAPTYQGPPAQSGAVCRYSNS